MHNPLVLFLWEFEYVHKNTLSGHTIMVSYVDKVGIGHTGRKMFLFYTFTFLYFFHFEPHECVTDSKN